MPLALSLFLICVTIIFPGCAKTPFLDSVSPSREKPGEKVYLKGKDFGKTQGKGAVTFDGDKTAFIISWSDTTINCVIPDGLEKGQSKIAVKNNEGKDSNTIIMNIEKAETDSYEEYGQESKQTENLEYQKNEKGVEQQTVPGKAVDNEQKQEAEKCKSVMLAYARQHSESGIEFTIDQFWMNDECTEAEAILEGKWTSGSNEGQSVESPGITAEKDGGSWTVTDFGTGIDLQHL